uniref:Uncharacterized protein n=1 Tax=Polytomella parva TaxID=51329 RepID=A0A7S0UTB2_9CHLO|mmetsp:Transcript_17106/g.31149  ORF Transcript_17106/g.31149 Transcript_17106/m.31149 type:complete len:345 (+) Transcript_17106:210-1244(+)
MNKNIKQLLFLCFLFYYIALTNIGVQATNELINSTIFPFPLEKPFPESEIKLKIVYYAYLPSNKNGSLLIEAQLTDLKQMGVLSEAELHIVLCTPLGANETKTISAKRLLDGVNFVDTVLKGAANYSIEAVIGNFWEYPGISHYWRWARSIINDSEAQRTVMLYMHSKGMVFHGLKHKRIDLQLMNTVVSRWREVKKRFSEDTHLMKAGLIPSGAGFIWFNFFWARAHYVNHLYMPVRSDNFRHYYEGWLATMNGRSFRNGVDLNFNLIPPWDAFRLAPSRVSSCADTWAMVIKQYQRGLSSDAANAIRLINHPDDEAKVANATKKLVTRSPITGDPCYHFNIV